MHSIHIIHGPSCSGKSTFLAKQQGKLIELDDISNRLADELIPVETIIKTQQETLLGLDCDDDVYVTASFLPQLHKHSDYWSDLESKLDCEVRHLLVLPRLPTYIYRVVSRYVNEDRVYTTEQVRRYQFMSKGRYLNLFRYVRLYVQYYSNRRCYQHVA